MPFITELKDFVAGGANTVIIGFMAAFIIMLLWGFVKGVARMSMKDLFIDERSGHISHTKYWSNVAYLSATVAFLVLNLFYFKEIEKYVELLWIIYLGVVASSATISKLISYKYGVKADAPPPPPPNVQPVNPDQS